MHAAKPPPGLIFILTFAARCRYRLSISRTALWGRLGSFSSLLRHILTADWPQGAGGPPPASREARRAAQTLYSPGVSKAGLPESCSLWLTGEAHQTNRQRNPTGEVKNLGIIPAISVPKPPPPMPYLIFLHQCPQVEHVSPAVPGYLHAGLGVLPRGGIAAIQFVTCQAQGKGSAISSKKFLTTGDCRTRSKRLVLNAVWLQKIKLKIETKMFYSQGQP